MFSKEVSDKNRGTSLIGSLLLSASSLLIILGLAEGAFRSLPVCDNFKPIAVNDTQPVLRFEPNRNLTWSRGWNFSIVNDVHINNYGFVSDLEYKPKDKSPLIALVGDSYVEAAMVPWGESISGLLHKSKVDKARVYSFGTSGAPLSQYLALAEVSRNDFKPDAMVLLVVGNDFDESILGENSSRGNHYFKETPSGEFELTRLDYTPRGLYQTFLLSSLALYVNNNLLISGVSDVKKHLSAKIASEGAFAGNTSASLDSARVRKSKAVVDAFLKELPQRSGLPYSKIIIVLDAFRDHMNGVGDINAVNYFTEMRKYLETQAVKNGISVIDLHPVFEEHYKKHKQPFEFPTDAHWNTTAHKLAAEAIAEHPLIASFK